MNKKQLIAVYSYFISSNALNAKDVVVDAGGALVLMGMREKTSDIDVVTTSAIFNRFKDAGYPTRIFPATGTHAAVEVVAATDLIDLHLHTSRRIHRVCTDGVWHESAEDVLAFKLSLNRPKDQNDIAALKYYVSSKLGDDISIPEELV